MNATSSCSLLTAVAPDDRIRTMNVLREAKRTLANHRALKVLIIDTSARRPGWMRILFEGDSKEFSSEIVSSLADARRILALFTVDILLLTLETSEACAILALRNAFVIAPGLPIVVRTTISGTVLASETARERARRTDARASASRFVSPPELPRRAESADKGLIGDDVLAHVSHELLLPVTAIHQFVTLLRDRLTAEQKLEQLAYLNIVLRNVTQLECMVDDLLDGARVEDDTLSIHPQCASIADAIAYAIETLRGAATAKGIAIRERLGAGAEYARADPVRLRQILLILGDNAIKFTPAGGSVEIGALLLDGDPATLVVKVEDTGCGIEPRMTKRIFERHVQEHHASVAGRRGLGLGLYICRNLVHRHGGRIWAANVPGSGAAVSLTLPAFLLPQLLAPAFRRATSLQRPLSMAITTIDSGAGWRSVELRAEHLRTLRDIVQRSLQSDDDRLLPRMDCSATRDRILVLAGPHGEGGVALAQRIRDSVSLHEYALRTGLMLETHCHLLAPASADLLTSPACQVTRAISLLEDYLCEPCSPRIAQYGKEESTHRGRRSG